MQKNILLYPLSRPLGVFLLFFFLFLFISTRYAWFLDPDVFYHLKHALILAQEGGFVFVYPWFPLHHVAVHPVNPYFLHHLILSLLLKIGADPVLTMKCFASMLSASVFTALYVILSRLKITAPFLWTLFAATSNGGFLFRLLLERPFTIGILLFFVGTYLLVRKHYLWVGILTVIYMLSYNLAPLLLMPAVIVLLLRGCIEREWTLRPMIAVLAGLTIGLLLHPHTISYILLIKAHLIDIFWLQALGVPLPVGGEIIAGVSPSFFKTQIIPILLLFLSIVLFFARTYKAKDTSEYLLVYTYLIIAILWFPVAVGIHRGLEYWYPATWIASSIILSRSWSATFSHYSARLRQWLLIVLLSAGGGIILISQIYFTEFLLAQGQGQTNIMEAITDLVPVIETEAATTLWYPQWHLFPFLFYALDYPTAHRFVTAFDPTFLYLYNDDTYFSWYYLATEGTSCFSQADCPNTLTPSTLLRNVFDSQLLILPTNTSTTAAIVLDPDIYEIYGNEQYTLYGVRDLQ